MKDILKVLSLADIHLCGGPETDEAQALLKVVEIAEEHRITVLLINGDVFHSKSTPAQRWVFKDFLERIIRRGIEVLILRGNHDEELDLTVYESHSVFVYEKPGKICLDGLTIHTIPHHNAGAIALQVNSQSEMGDTGTGLYDQMIHAIYNEIKTTEGPSMVAFHGTITGAHLDNGMIPKHDGIVLNGPLLASLGVPVRGGHYHAAQEPHPNVRYSGSITLRNYGESGDKGVLIDTWEDGEWIGCEFVSLNPAPRITIETEWITNVGLSDTVNYIFYGEGPCGFCWNSEPAKPFYKGARVKFRYKVKQSEVPTLDLDEVKAFFESAGVRELKLERDLIIETAIRSESIQQAQTELDMHLVWLESKGLGQHKDTQKGLYQQICEGIEKLNSDPVLVEGENTRHEATIA